jgi:D-glycero-D-manno-heptose 1,7-bisphosphate phosphatase
MSLRAVIFDRDGVLNEDTGYAHKASDLIWTPGAMRAISLLNKKKVLALVATNQSGVARGYYREDDVRRFHDTMQATLSRVGAHIDAFYFCPFHHEASVAAYHHLDHPDRKPNPGMILRALSDWSLAPGDALMIGDRDSDIEAAARAGVRGLLYEGGDLEALVESQIG